LTADVTGEVEKEGRVLVIRRVHVVYTVRASAGDAATIERVHAMHAPFCPVYLTLKPAIEITTEYRLLTE
jgi:uncharacterized OsmC-like protein